MKPLHTFICCTTAALAACSTTSNLPEGDVLYTGMKATEYTDSTRQENFDAVYEEVEAAIAAVPNGAILSSPYMRSPLQVGLATYNTFRNAETGLGKWLCDHFGSEPILLGSVNANVRSLVATNILRANGYFGAQVKADTIQAPRSRKAKLKYTVTMGPLHRVDTLQYLGYPPEMQALIDSAMPSRKVWSGAPFSASSLDAERTRLSTLFRNNGYYYYRPAYSTFTADSVSKPGVVQVRMQPADGISSEATRKWHLGKLRMQLRRTVMQPLTDSVAFRVLSVHFSGKKPPIRPSTLLRDIKLRPGQLYSLANVTESANVINSLGVFSLSEFALTPRDSSSTCDTLDVTLNCVLDKPYDASIEASYSIKSNDRTGPGLTLGLTKRNAFRGGEKLSLNLKGSYEWQTGRRVQGNSQAINSYEYGADLSIEYPRIEAPFHLFRRHRFHTPPSTVFSLSGDVLNRASFFKMLTVTGAVTYTFQTSANSHHELSPFLLDYTYLQSTTPAFDSIVTANPAIYVSMRNQFVPKIKYTYTYTSPSSLRNPISWEATLTEAGNILSLGYKAAGKDFGQKEKDLFGNPFAQFVKLTTSFRKTWALGLKSQLVGHVAAGVIVAYGNSDRAPYSEQFYVGGANSIRAFAIRSIGPGKYVAPSTNYAYLDQTGDIKLEANLEYRPHLFGSLYGALFVDAGNVWLLKKDDSRPDAQFKPSTFLSQLATGTGFGLRYDLDFLVLRLDLGIALHVPYDTGKSGYYNIPKFRDGLGFHFAIGYPF